ncbi:MAG: hypothetical protein WCL06_10465 [Bacteroidota bacterium]
MKIHRTILQCKSRFYYYTLLLIGSAGMLFFTRCSGPNNTDNTAHLQDSLVKAKHQQDSIAKSDSLGKAQREQARQDSIVRADSIAKAKKHSNPYKPKPVITKYGIPMEQPTKYGVPTNNYK